MSTGQWGMHLAFACARVTCMCTHIATSRQCPQSRRVYNTPPNKQNLIQANHTRERLGCSQSCKPHSKGHKRPSACRAAHLSGCGDVVPSMRWSQWMVAGTSELGRPELMNCSMAIWAVASCMATRSRGREGERGWGRMRSEWREKRVGWKGRGAAAGQPLLATLQMWPSACCQCSQPNNAKNMHMDEKCYWRHDFCLLSCN